MVRKFRSFKSLDKTGIILFPQFHLLIFVINHNVQLISEDGILGEESGVKVSEELGILS